MGGGGGGGWQRTGLARGCGAAGRGRPLWSKPCRLGEEEVGLGELMTPWLGLGLGLGIGIGMGLGLEL